MRNCFGTFVALFFAALLIPCERAYAVAGDYDGDGLADLAIIDADKPENKTTVFVRNSSNGSTTSHVFFPFGDTVISGRFFGPGRTYPGIVSAGSGSQLFWHIKLPGGGESVFPYGVIGDTVANSGDLDCDGTDDALVSRTGKAGYWPGFKLWYAALSSTPGIFHETVFGIDGDKTFTADVDGDGCSELVALRADYQWFSRKFFGSEVSVVQWGLPGDYPLLPADVTGDGRPDHLVTRDIGGSQVLFVRSADGTGSTAGAGNAGSIPSVGNYFGTNTLGWFHRERGLFGLRQLDQSVFVVPFGNERRGVLRPDGTSVAENEDGKFPGRVTTSDDSGVECDIEISRRDGSGGFKNNPENSRGTLKIMYPKSYTGDIKTVKAYSSGGSLIDTLRLGGLEWGNRERWYGSKSLRVYPDNLLVVARLDDGRDACVTLPDPEKVYD